MSNFIKAIAIVGGGMIAGVAISKLINNRTVALSEELTQTYEDGEIRHYTIDQTKKK